MESPVKETNSRRCWPVCHRNTLEIFITHHCPAVGISIGLKMKTQERAITHARSASGVIAQTQAEISNIVDLFEALAVGWVEGGNNRYLVAGEHRSFVRVTAPAFHSFLHQNPGDIPVVVRNFAYSMRGFIRFEADQLYRGMFETSRASDGEWYSATLTAAGFRFSQAPVFDVATLHKDIARCPFFNPVANDAGADLLLAYKGTQAVQTDHQPQSSAHAGRGRFKVIRPPSDSPAD